jgi:DNA-binding MarR family transcriptional regulator
MAWASWTSDEEDRAARNGAEGAHGNAPARPVASPAARTIMLDLRPTILVAARAGAAARLAGWAERAGLRCVGQIEPEALAERLGLIVAVDFILVDLRARAGESGLDCRTARLLAARPGLDDSRLAILTDLAGLDWVMARIDTPDAEILCEPQIADIVSLLVMAALGAEDRDRGVRFHDATHDGEAARIDRLSEEVRRLAATIDRLTRNEDESGAGVMDQRGSYRAPDESAETEPGERFRVPLATAGGNPSAAASPTHGEIRALLRARRLREQFLPADLFADPAWDMMLDLMAARLCGQRVSVSSLCIAAAVPPTTALRWIRQLTERGVFARIDDPADGRRVFIELTDEAADALSGWAIAVRKHGGLLAGPARH